MLKIDGYSVVRQSCIDSLTEAIESLSIYISIESSPKVKQILNTKKQVLEETLSTIKQYVK